MCRSAPSSYEGWPAGIGSQAAGISYHARRTARPEITGRRTDTMRQLQFFHGGDSLQLLPQPAGNQLCSRGGIESLPRAAAGTCRSQPRKQCLHGGAGGSSTSSRCSLTHQCLGGAGLGRHWLQACAGGGTRSPAGSAPACCAELEHNSAAAGPGSPSNWDSGSQGPMSTLWGSLEGGICIFK